jgi:hypothetical protein
MRQQMEHILDYELGEGENLLWSGQADALRIMRGSLPVLFIAIPLLVVFLLGIYGIFMIGPLSPSSIPIVLFLVLLLLPGLLLASIPYRTYRRSQRIIYAVTDRRVLIITAGEKRSVMSFGRADIGAIERIEGSGEKGDIVFGWQRNIRFTGVPHVRMVEQILFRTFKGEFPFYPYR